MYMKLITSSINFLISLHIYNIAYTSSIKLKKYQYVLIHAPMDLRNLTSKEKEVC